MAVADPTEGREWMTRGWGQFKSSFRPRWLAELDRGDVEALLAAARQLTLADAPTPEMEKALGYFETNQERMRYAQFRAQTTTSRLGSTNGGSAASSPSDALVRLTGRVRITGSLLGSDGSRTRLRMLTAVVT